MLFFKPKAKSDEILPPPPPFPTLELEEEKEGPLLFDEVAKPEAKAEGFPEEKDFGDLMKELDEGLKPEKEVSKKEGIKAKKGKLAAKRQKITKKEKIALAKQVKGKKLPRLIKTKAAELPEPEEELALKDIGFELQKETWSLKGEIKLPGAVENLDIGDAGKELGFEEAERPKEILEAEEEIKGAIEKIKKQEKPSFLKSLFAGKKKAEERHEESLMPELSEADEVSIIKDSISKTRGALMRFDLGTAKRNYIELMKVYNRIKPEDQAKVYHDIRELYFERKSAEELKV